MIRLHDNSTNCSGMNNHVIFKIAHEYTRKKIFKVPAESYVYLKCCNHQVSLQLNLRWQSYMKVALTDTAARAFWLPYQLDFYIENICLFPSKICITMKCCDLAIELTSRAGFVLLFTWCSSRFQRNTILFARSLQLADTKYMCCKWGFIGETVLFLSYNTNGI